MKIWLFGWNELNYLADFLIVIFEKNSERSEFLQKFKVVIFKKKLWNVPNFSQKLRSKNQLNNL